VPLGALWKGPVRVLRIPSNEYRGIPIMGMRGIHERVTELLARLPHGARVLDVPAGRGALTLRLHDQGLAAEGADLFPDLFQAPDLRCTQADMNGALPFDDGTFDAVATVEGIEHLENPFGFVRECHRVLKRRGLLVLTTPNILVASSRLRFFLTGFFSLARRPLNEFASDPTADHISPKTFAQLRHMLHTSGFHITEVGAARVGWYNAWFYLFWPLAYARAAAALKAEPDERQRAANREILRAIVSPPLLLGRIVVLAAERTG